MLSTPFDTFDKSITFHPGSPCNRGYERTLAKAVSKMFHYLDAPPASETRMANTPVHADAPLAPVRFVTKRGYSLWQVIRCPYCESTHEHGADADLDQSLSVLGGRMAHCHPERHVGWDVIDATPCWNGDAEYRLVAIEGMPTARELDEHFPTVLGTELDGLHVSKWSLYLDLSTEYIAYQSRIGVPGYVYVMESGGHHKIGITKDVDRRLAAIATGSPFPVKLVHCAKVQNPKALERTLHEFCARDRVHLEWFALDDSLLQQVVARIEKEATS